MKHAVGIDLGSTTTKAVILGEDETLLGRGITNSRSNYDVACQVALGEALTNARFSLVASGLADADLGRANRQALISELKRRFAEQQYRAQLEVLAETQQRLLTSARHDPTVADALAAILAAMRAEVPSLYAEGATRKSDFFRDLAGSRYLKLAETQGREDKRPASRCSGTDDEQALNDASLFDRLVGLFDKAILEVENTPDATGFEDLAQGALSAMEPSDDLRRAVATAVDTPLEQIGSVGTGYGRQRLPFPEGSIRSEILCHGLGAHAMYPGTRTVLDIGGQDTKAIQVDDRGIVTSFQMNDRCAAGCGRYLGYIADEMNLGLHELGPLAERSDRPARINSTCTVFAGAELRERLSLGERREDILAGLHRAIIVRAMSLLARSGGVSDEFTFTGGVANNPAAVQALRRLVRDNYGKITMNISPDSIYTGALGAALFALRGAAKPEQVPA